LKTSAALARRRTPKSGRYAARPLDSNSAAAALSVGDPMTAPVTLRLNPRLDLAPFAETYRRRGIVQIPDILDTDAAEATASLLARSVPWRLILTDDSDKPVHFSREETQALGRERFQAMMQDALARARLNRGYVYNMYPMIEAYLKGWDRGHPIHLLTELINSEDFLGLGRAVCGVPGITKADAHATLYGPGHYLTRHLDFGDDLERRAAYVMGFTKNWQPDWGGLLLFLNEKQDVTEGYLPRFNVLTIFDIKYLHTVTQVSSFAGGGRYSVTGWFRDDPTRRSA
jgi:Rps23 Pro-64 3,4-dihydroxylase Tpa1-like proline 4-hydroxylase